MKKKADTFVERLAETFQPNDIETEANMLGTSNLEQNIPFITRIEVAGEIKSNRNRK